jgi:hypothetical protein
MRLPFALQSYRHRDLPVSAQRLINWMPEAQTPDAKARVITTPTPGLRQFTLLPQGPVRGMEEMRGVLYVVAGDGVYTVDASGTLTLLGTIAEGGPVSMDGNGTQMVIVAPETRRAWVATTTTLAQITDTDFLPCTSVACIDGYHVFTRADSTQFFISAINDATSYDALDFASAEGSPDNLVVARRIGRELWLFGETSTEIWSNVGAADFPFLRVSGAFVERGCAARFSVASRLSTPFWLGDDRVIYRADGFTPVRISTHAIEQAIGGYTTVSDARGWVYEQEGHVFYVLSFPTEGETWVYDLGTQLWHERESEGYGVWRCNVGGNFFGGALAGDAVDGRIYVIDPTLSTEAGDQIIRVATGTASHAEARPVWFTRFELETTTGNGLAVGQGSDPQIFLSWSDDGGRTWSNESWRGLGAQGRYTTRCEWRRLGRARDRVFRLQMADPVRTSLIAVNIEAEAGE